MRHLSVRHLCRNAMPCMPCKSSVSEQVAQPRAADTHVTHPQAPRRQGAHHGMTAAVKKRLTARACAEGPDGKRLVLAHKRSTASHVQGVEANGEFLLSDCANPESPCAGLRQHMPLSACAPACCAPCPRACALCALYRGTTTQVQQDLNLQERKQLVPSCGGAVGLVGACWLPCLASFRDKLRVLLLLAFALQCPS